jgi:hypothetical protein
MTAPARPPELPEARLEHGDRSMVTVVPHAPAAPAADRATRPGAGPELLDRVAWRDAGVAWLGQHALLLAVTYLGRTLVLIPSYTQGRLTWASMFAPWLTWDADIYARIAREGYDRLWLTRFFPLLPALEHALAPLTGGNPAIAGLLVSNAACLVAFALLRVLVEREMGLEASRRALLYLAVFPTSFFFAAAYAEAPFLALALGTFLALRRGHWPVAGVCAALATLARPVGILLAVPIAIECWRRLRERGRASTGRPYERADEDGARPSAVAALTGALPRPGEAAAMLAGLALPAAALAGYSAYLYPRYHTFVAFIQAQDTAGGPGSGKGFTWPWIGFARAGHALLVDGLNPNFFQVHIVLDAGFTLALIAVTLATIGRVPWPYVGYAFAVVALLLCTPGHNWYALFSNMRFILEIPPFFMVLARWGERRNVELALLGAALPLLTLLTLTFVIGGWVA